MTERTHEDSNPTERELEQRREFRSYVWGFGLALLLTLVPFALVHGQGIARSASLIVIGVLSLAQMLVHFRCFLHIGLRRRREDLHLILFSALLLLIMVAGTIWIMSNLATRMTMPMAL